MALVLDLQAIGFFAGNYVIELLLIMLKTLAATLIVAIAQNRSELDSCHQA